MDLVSSIGCGFSSQVMGLRGSELSINQTVEYVFFFLKKKKVDFELVFRGEKKFFKNFFDILQWYFSDPEIPKLLMWFHRPTPKVA